MQIYFGIAVGVDLTRRDLQTEAKHAGRPWFVGKKFLEAPVSEIIPINSINDFQIRTKTRSKWGSKAKFFL